MAQNNSSNGFGGATFSGNDRKPASPIVKSAHELATHECPKGRKAFCVQANGKNYFTYAPNQDNALSRVAKALGFRVSQMSTLKQVTVDDVQASMNGLSKDQLAEAIKLAQAELKLRQAQS